MQLAVIVSLLAGGVSGVAIVGLNQPISISIANGRVYIAEKDGAVKVAANPATDTSAAMLLNIQDEVCQRFGAVVASLRVPRPPSSSLGCSSLSYVLPPFVDGVLWRDGPHVYRRQHELHLRGLHGAFQLS